MSKQTPIIVSRLALENDPDFKGFLFGAGLDAPVYVVTWPEHVHSPKYNGDADYHPFETLAPKR